MAWKIFALLGICVLSLFSGFSEAKLVGGWSEGNVDSEEVTKLVNFAVESLESQSNTLYRQRVLEISKVLKQVVAGVLYNVTFQMGSTNCRKGSPKKVETCPYNENESPQECTVQVWTKSWEDFRQLKSFSCKSISENKKRSVKKLGGDNHDYGHLGVFKKFVKKYNKMYSDEFEYKKRFRIFRDNMKKIRELQKYEQGTAKYGVTEFADLTKDEFKKYYLGTDPKLSKVYSKLKAEIPNVQIPDSFDWRDHNAVTVVKNQGMCGSCWAFSVTGNVEGQWALNKGKLVSLSEQELVDCDTLDEGCNGGYMTNAYEEIIKLGGLETETDYPYEGEDEKCHIQKAEIKVSISNYMNISTNETEMAQWLYKNGPISIAINANAMQFYFGGISHPWKFLCSPDDLDHGVLIVGYGSHHYSLFNRTVPFWIVKNSWGKSWGEKGYYRVYRGDGTCGLNLMASSALVN